jgi:hypothetical protein
MALQTDHLSEARPSRKRKTADTAQKHRKNTASPVPNETQMVLFRYLPAWLILAAVFTIFLPHALNTVIGTAGRAIAGVPVAVSGPAAPISPITPVIAPMFTAEIDHWAEDIRRWAAQYEVDPNLLATIMQIESCGHDTVGSHAGAQGLFQVMPFHFAPGEVYTDPDTNAKRGANFINECLGYSNGDVGLALACYNGGPSVTMRPFNTWPNETQRYYTWGLGIYNDAVNNQTHSQTLDAWLQAGGVNLCNRAATERQGREATHSISSPSVQ